jgi:hypothetical protein
MVNCYSNYFGTLRFRPDVCIWRLQTEWLILVFSRLASADFAVARCQPTSSGKLEPQRHCKYSDHLQPSPAFALATIRSRRVSGCENSHLCRAPRTRSLPLPPHLLRVPPTTLRSPSRMPSQGSFAACLRIPTIITRTRESRPATPA